MELLRNVDAHRGAQLISSILQAIGVGLLAVPLYYLFRAAQARNEVVRGQLVGVVIAGAAVPCPVGDPQRSFHAQRGLGVRLNESAAADRKGWRWAATALTTSPATRSPTHSLRPLAAGFGLGGQIGFLVAMFYGCLHAMRTGLLTRFWGSLGMAIGAVSFVFFQFGVIWFLYFGFLLMGWVPGGRPPAWETGEAIPWPTPGEKAAAELETSADDDPPKSAADLTAETDDEEQPR